LQGPAATQKGRVMAAYLVTYDLNQVGQNYDCIIKKLEAYPTHWHMQKSVWIIQTDATAYQVAEHLESCLDSNDNLFVTQVTANSAWSGFSDQASNWVRQVI
jgi:hypothetical protein